MYQDLTIVVASVFFAAVVGLGVVVVLMMRSLIRRSRSAKRAANDATSRVARERLASSRSAARPPAVVAQPTMAEQHTEPTRAVDASRAIDAAGPVDTRPDIVIIGGQPIAWGQPTIREPNPREGDQPTDLRDQGRPTPAWPRLIRNAGVALLVVALVGVASMAISSNLGTAIPSGGVLGATTGVPSPEPAASAPDTQRSKAPGAPPAVVAALRGTAVVNDRLAVDADILATALARKSVRAVDLARQLRALVSDADLGTDLANRLEPWADADSLRSELSSFYESVSVTARDGLRAPLSDLRAYRSAATSMLDVVAELRELDAASRELAKTVPVELPPLSVDLPE